jgi:hypothetical protein
VTLGVNRETMEEKEFEVTAEGEKEFGVMVKDS